MRHVCQKWHSWRSCVEIVDLFREYTNMTHSVNNQQLLYIVNEQLLVNANIKKLHRKFRR